MKRQMDEQTGERTQNMLDDHLFQCMISPWPKTAEKRGFCTGVTDGPMDGPTDQRTDRPTDGRTDNPSYRDARTHLKRCSIHSRVKYSTVECCRSESFFSRRNFIRYQLLPFKTSSEMEQLSCGPQLASSILISVFFLFSFAI